MATKYSVEEICGDRRTKKLARVRFAIFFVARENGFSLPHIGSLLCKHHTSVMYGCEQAEILYERDDEFKRLVDQLRNPETIKPVPANAITAPAKKAMEVREELAKVYVPPAMNEDERYGRDTDAIKRKIGTDRLLAALLAA